MLLFKLYKYIWIVVVETVSPQVWFFIKKPCGILFFSVVDPHHSLHLVLYVWLTCCLTKITAVPVLPAATHTHPHTHTPELAALPMAATNSVSKLGGMFWWQDLKYCPRLHTLFNCCWLRLDRSEMTGCHTVSMNPEVLGDSKEVLCPVEVADLLRAESAVAKLHVCFVPGPQPMICLQNATGAAWLYPASLPNTPPTCPRSISPPPLSPPPPSPLHPINHSPVFLCTLLLYVVPGLSSASLTHATSVDTSGFQVSVSLLNSFINRAADA